MNETTASEFPEDPRLQEAAAIYLAGQASQEELLQRYPELRPRLQELFANEQWLLSHIRPSPKKPDVPQVPAPPTPEGLARYQIRGELGHGGMGIVYRAYDTVLGREVALKLLHAEFAGDPRRIDRMRSEARINARLNHAGIVPVHDIGQAPDGRPFITMRIVEGESLSKLLAARTHKLDWNLEIFGRACEAVAFAHSLNPPVLHRDLKPANIVVSGSGEVYTLDWGLAKMRDGVGSVPVPDQHLGSTSADASQPGTMIGTLAYMPPEQALGDRKRIGPASDVFGLGTVLFQILTGDRPYLNVGSRVELERLARGPGLPILWAHLDRCKVDQELKAIARKCLAEKPDERFLNAGELANRFRAYQQSVRDRLEAERVRRARSETRRRGQLVAGSILFFALGIGFLGWQSVQSAAQERRAGNNRKGNDFLAYYAEVRAQAETHKESGDLGKSLESLRRAKVARDQFEGLVAGGEIDAPIHVELRRVRAEIDGALETTGRQQRLLGQLREASSLAGARIAEFEVDQAVAAQAFRTAFADYGIVPGLQPAVQTHELVSQLPDVIRAEALVGLEYWSYLSPTERPKIRPLVASIDHDPWRMRTREAIEKGDLAALRRLAQEAPLGATPVTGLRVLLLALRLGGGVDEAVNLLRRALPERPREFWLQLELAHCLERQFPPRGEEIIASYRAAVALDDRNALAWMGLAYSLAAAGQSAESNRCYLRALKEAPENPMVRLSQVGIRVMRGRAEDLGDLHALHKRYPERADVTAILARYLALKPATVGEARKLIDEARRLDKDCSQIPMSEALVALTERRYSDYLRVIQKLREADPGDQNLVRAECLGLLVVGNCEDAEDLARRCLEGGQLATQFAQLCGQLLAYSLILQGRAAAAEPWAREAMRLNVADKQASLEGRRRTLFQVFLQQGKFAEALAVRPKPSDSSGAILPLTPGVAALAADVMLERFSQLRSKLLDGNFDKVSGWEIGMAAETGLAIGMPRYAYPAYRYMIGQGKVPVLENMVGNAPSPLWTNELYRLTTRMNGARAAVRAACDPVREPIKSVPEDREQARTQALRWLRTELDGLRVRAKKTTEHSSVNGILCFMQRCPDFAGVRDVTELVKLPDAERKNWQQFWGEVASLRQNVRWKVKPSKQT